MAVSTSPPAARRDILSARRLAILVLEQVLRRRLPLDEQIEVLGQREDYTRLSPADRGLTRAIATATLRRLGTLRQALKDRMPRGMPQKSGRLEEILLAATAQLLVLEIAPHAAVDTAIDLVREDAHARHFADLANAVLRRIASEKAAILASGDPLATDTPAWLAERWSRTYGPDVAAAIARAHNEEAAVDLTVKSDPEGWAERLGAVLLPTGSVRLSVRTPVTQLPGFVEGDWWVQDAAAALPARLLRAGAGQHVLDLCAAPGGKTAQLALTGAQVTAIDRSATRMDRLRVNMNRIGLPCETHVGTAESYAGPPADAVLLDAPCSATGTLRRHPDVGWSKTLEDILKLSSAQSRLLDKAATLVKPGGVLVYATCSLEREEGEQQVARFLDRTPAFRRDPVGPQEVGGLAELITTEGDLRCLPCHLPNAIHRLSGLDGFYAARLVKHR